MSFSTENEKIAKCLKITDKGDSDFNKGQIVPKTVLEETNAKIETLGGKPAKGTKPKAATFSTQLLGITKASVQSSSFISAASFQETTKVLTEAALGGKVDNLVGLKENVILGHLIPAGTGFKTFQDSEVQYNLEAMRQIASTPSQTLEESFPLLEAGSGDGSSRDGESGFGRPSAASSLEDLMRGDSGASMEMAGVHDAPSLMDMTQEVAPSTDFATPSDIGLAGMSRPADSGFTGTGGFADGDGPIVHEALPRDDLTQIEGIGPKIADLLSSAGITTYARLEKTSVEQLRQILATAGGSFAVHDPETWPAQAALAANDEWDKLKAWQNSLYGGVEVEPTAAANQEDLTRIEGVGPKTQGLLYAAGITTYAQLAATDADQIRAILAANGMAGHDPETWPAQAALAANDEWDKLQAWQDQLDGGRPSAEAPAADQAVEDLKLIEGVGPKVEELLYAAGITSYTALGNTEVSQIRRLLAEAGGLMATFDPSTWPDQAKLAAAGEWDKLKAWQAELDGGIA